MWERIRSFIFFESPLQSELISRDFSDTHLHFQREFPHWSLEATRKKVVFEFWFKEVFLHYFMILSLATIATMPFLYNQHYLFLSINIAGFLSFLVLLFRIYWPAYFTDFLPKLDTIIAERQNIQEAELELKKCKRSQFSIPTLTIIYYVFSKTSGIPILPANDHSAALLNKLFGADRDKLKQNLSRLCQLSKLSPKERAEMQKGIDIGREFFETLGCSPALTILDQLDLKLQKV